MNVAARLEGLAEPGGIHRRAGGDVAGGARRRALRPQAPARPEAGAARRRNYPGTAPAGRGGCLWLVVATGRRGHRPAAAQQALGRGVAVRQPHRRRATWSARGRHVENVIADLSRFGLFVIARGTSFSYRDKPREPRAVGRELGVRYVVEGSLQGDGQRLRASVHLVDASNGGQVWSERYDRPLDDLFAVQDELSQRIANSIGGLYGAARQALTEAARRKAPENLEAYDLYLLAIEARRSRDKDGELRAQELIRRSLDLDPTFAGAYGVLGATYRRQVQNNWAPREEAMAAWLAAAQRAVELDPNDGWARMLLSDRYGYSNDLALCAAELLRAAELADGDAALMILGRGGSALDRADPAGGGPCRARHAARSRDDRRVPVGDTQHLLLCPPLRRRRGHRGGHCRY